MSANKPDAGGAKKPEQQAKNDMDKGAEFTAENEVAVQLDDKQDAATHLHLPVLFQYCADPLAFFVYDNVISKLRVFDELINILHFRMSQCRRASSISL